MSVLLIKNVSSETVLGKQIKQLIGEGFTLLMVNIYPVSYTHLDVYKRQVEYLNG